MARFPHIRTGGIDPASMATARALAWAMLWLVGAALPGLVQAAADVTPPSITVCDNVGSTSPSNSGSLPLTPGAWWNPKRDGTGWSLNFVSADGQPPTLVAFWFTFGRDRRPIWLLAAAPVDSVGNSAAGLLGRYTWNGTSSVGARVGSVAWRFSATDPTVAAVRWQWDEVGTGVYEECIRDFARNTAHTATTPDAVNAAWSGAWNEPALNGWGVSTAIAQQLDNNHYFEIATIEVYDSVGQPVWVQGVVNHGAQPPPVGSPLPTPMGLAYVRAGSGYPNGVPTNDCVTNCQAPISGAGTYNRTFFSATQAAASVAVVATSTQTGGQAINWKRPPTTVPSPTVSMAKLTTADLILVNRLACSIASGASTCPIVVNWGSAQPTAKAFRRNLASQAMTQLGTSANGEFTDNLAAGARYQYELRKSSATGALISKSPEVRATQAAVNNQPPTVALTAPTAGASLPPAQATTLRASAADADGSITKVEFFSGATSLGISPSTANPYTLSWTPTVLGNYTLTAKATDNAGAVTTSLAVMVTVEEVVLCFKLPPAPGSAL